MSSPLEGGLVGWRRGFADRLEQPLARATRLSAAHVRAILGGLFLLEHTLYLVRALRRASRR